MASGAAAVLEQAKQIARRDLLAFGRLVAPHLFRASSPPIHRELADIALKKGLKRICVQAPRGSAKTTLLGTLLPLHLIVHAEQPEMIVIASATEDQAQATLDAVKALATSPIVRALYGTIGGEGVSKAWSEDEATFRNDMIMVKARGLNQQIRGLHYRNQRPTLFILDDPDDEDTARSPDKLEMHWRRLTKEILPAVDPQRGRVIVIGTPVHHECIVERLSRSKTWHFRRYQALIRKVGVPDSAPEYDKWESYWPDWHPVRKLVDDREEARDRGRLSEWYSEYMCLLIGDDTAPFTQEMIRYWLGSIQPLAGFLSAQDQLQLLKIEAAGSRTYNPPDERPVVVTMGVDPAASTKRGADFTAVVVAAMDAEGRIFVLHAERFQKRPLAAAMRITELYRKYRPSRVAVETQGYQEMLRDVLKQECPEMPVIGLKVPPNTRKEQRILGLQPEFEGGRVFLRTEHTELVQELLQFPRGQHDDLLDAFYYARRVLYPSPVDRVETSEKQRERRAIYYWMTL